MIKKGVILLLIFLLGLVTAEVLFYLKLDKSLIFETKKNTSVSPSPQPASGGVNGGAGEATIRTILEDVRPLLASNVDAQTEFTVQYEGLLKDVFFDFQSKTDPNLVIPLAIIVLPNGENAKELEIDFTENDLKTAPLVDEAGKKVDYKTLKPGQMLTIKSTYNFKENTEPSLTMQVSSAK